ncbi:hypothetical protein QUF80_08925 [Desulfococcaceae bacterium HSG8]|nr:hypothetical protein [Desulfococcaceae bacterium HSG8]
MLIKRIWGHVMDASATYNFNDNLPKRDGGNVLPGFRLPVSELFKFSG